LAAREGMAPGNCGLRRGGSGAARADKACCTSWNHTCDSTAPLSLWWEQAVVHDKLSSWTTSALRRCNRSTSPFSSVSLVYSAGWSSLSFGTRGNTGLTPTALQLALAVGVATLMAMTQRPHVAASASPPLWDGISDARPAGVCPTCTRRPSPHRTITKAWV